MRKKKPSEDKSTGERWNFLGVVIAALITGIVTLIVAGKINIPPKSNFPIEIQPTQYTTLPLPKLSTSDYGDLLYEDSFDNDNGVWALPKGGLIQNGILLLPPSAFTFPTWNTVYSNFIFETEFQFINVISNDFSGMSVYLRTTKSSCPETTGICSDQIGVSTKGEVAAWRPNGTNNYERLLAETLASEFTSNGRNKLTIIVNKNEFRVYINDIFVRAFNDSTYKSGSMVLDVDGTSVAFDYVRFYAIP